MVAPRAVTRARSSLSEVTTTTGARAGRRWSGHDLVVGGAAGVGEHHLDRAEGQPGRDRPDRAAVEHDRDLGPEPPRQPPAQVEQQGPLILQPRSGNPCGCLVTL